MAAAGPCPTGRVGCSHDRLARCTGCPPTTTIADMGAVEFGLPHQLVADLSRALNITVAVETGTYRGDSARKLAETVQRVVSIELSEELHEAAKGTLSDLGNVTLLQGSSADVLAHVAADLPGPAIYWLDGHWCGAAGARSDEAQCPVMEEITAIDASDHAAQSCILIDDARLHLGPPPPPFRREDWPTITDIVDKLRATHERVFTVLDDVIIAGPPEIQSVIDTYWLDKQWQMVVAERDELRRHQWYPTLPDAARAVAKAVRGRLTG